MGFTFDISNESGRVAPEIEAIYLHTGSVWSVSQDDKPCASTKSDMPPFKKRHFLASPLKRVPPGAWAEIKVWLSGTIASSVKGEELKSSYRFGGRAALRIVTAEGNFDYPFNVDYDIDEIPF
jgi:hypothetical protein